MTPYVFVHFFLFWSTWCPFSFIVTSSCVWFTDRTEEAKNQLGVASLIVQPIAYLANIILLVQYYDRIEGLQCLSIIWWCFVSVSMSFGCLSIVKHIHYWADYLLIVILLFYFVLFFLKDFISNSHSCQSRVTAVERSGVDGGRDRVAGVSLFFITADHGHYRGPSAAIWCRRPNTSSTPFFGPFYAF